MLNMHPNITCLVCATQHSQSSPYVVQPSQYIVHNHPCLHAHTYMHIDHIDDALLLIRILSYSNNLHHNLNVTITLTMRVANNHNITIVCSTHPPPRNFLWDLSPLFPSHCKHSRIPPLPLICLHSLLSLHLLHRRSLHVINSIHKLHTDLVVCNTNRKLLRSFHQFHRTELHYGTSLVTISLAGFVLFTGYFLSKSSMPLYWLFIHNLSPYKYGLDALLANEYECESWRCFEWAEEGAVCEVTGRDVLEKRGLRAGERWGNVEVFLFYRVLYWVVLTRRASRSK